MDPTPPPDDNIFRELRAWLDGLSPDEVDEIASHRLNPAQNEPGAIDAFAADTTCAFGWMREPDGSLAEVSGWIGIPSRVVAAFGGVDVADDVVEVLPVGSPPSLVGVRARWSTYSQHALLATVAIRTNDGFEWPLVPIDDRFYAVEVPTSYLVPIADSSGLEFAIEASVVVAPRSSDLVEVDTVDVVVRRWAEELPDVAGSGLRTRSHGASTWVTRTIDEDRAAALGIAATVHLRRNGTDVAVRVVRVRPSAELQASIDGVNWISLSHAGNEVLLAQLQIDRDAIDLRVHLRVK